MTELNLDGIDGFVCGVCEATETEGGTYLPNSRLMWLVCTACSEVSPMLSMRML
jgi:translation initiation factor 2 beta subunit (eIF-2beta)/eIF-5